MSARVLLLAATTTLLAIGTAASAPLRIEHGPAAPGTPAAEVARIRAHFDSVLVELEAADIRALSTDQLNNRITLVATLTAYRDHGVFPQNHDFPGQAVPYFVDPRTGVLCAVAYLLESSGRRDIVDRVSHGDNNVWVPQLAGDTAFTAWLESQGITLAEAARIQVPYVQPTSKAEEARNVAFMSVAPFAIGGAAVTSLMNALGNADGHRTGVSKVGLASGIVTTAMGIALVGKSGIAPAVGASAIAVGGTSIALSTRSIRRNNAIVSAREAARERQVAASVQPTVDATRAPGARLAVTVQF
jgi:hypothetical protein